MVMWAAQRVLRIAERLGIEVVAKSAPASVRHGPQLHACDIRRRRVYLYDGKISDSQNVAYVLHEIMHVYLQPPWWRINCVPEEMVLLPVERTIARARLSPETYQHVLNYQHSTVTYASDSFDELGEVTYLNTTWWRRGFELARILGLLTGAGRPTYAWPDWSRIERVRRAVRGYFQDPDERKWPFR